VSKEQSVPFPYEHVTAFIARNLERIPFVQRIEKKVALHYHTGYEQSDRDWQNTRTILKAIPGLQLVDVVNPAALGRHCAPKWIKRVGRPQWQKAIADIMDAARDAQVDALASIYHSCHREICHAEARYPFAVVNYMDLLGEAMGITYPDLYKHYKLRGDPEAVFDELGPQIRAQGLDPVRVREVL